MEKRRNPKEQFLLFFHNIFNISQLQESNYILIYEMWLVILFFPQYRKSDMSSRGSRGTDISKYFRESLGDNESRLYSFYLYEGQRKENLPLKYSVFHYQQISAEWKYPWHSVPVNKQTEWKCATTLVKRALSPKKNMRECTLWHTWSIVLDKDIFFNTKNC